MEKKKKIIYWISGIIIVLLLAYFSYDYYTDHQEKDKVIETEDEANTNGNNLVETTDKLIDTNDIVFSEDVTGQKAIYLNAGRYNANYQISEGYIKIYREVRPEFYKVYSTTSDSQIFDINIGEEGNIIIEGSSTNLIITKINSFS